LAKVMTAGLASFGAGGGLDDITDGTGLEK
jgi:hypothetical protein